MGNSGVFKWPFQKGDREKIGKPKQMFIGKQN